MAGRRQKSHRARSRRARPHGARSQHVHETPEQMRARVLGAFERWLDERVPAGRARDDVLYTVRTACEFKDGSLDSPNPSDWSPHLVDEIIGDIFPRKIVGVDSEYIAAIVPAMHVYLDFLTETGRWKTGNDLLATRRALDGLATEVPLRVGNPMYQGMAGRMMQMAIDQGIDLTAEGAMDEVVGRFNAMPESFRRGLTPGDGLDGFVQAGEDDEDALFGVDDEDVILDQGTALALELALRGNDIDFKRPISVEIPAAEVEAAALRETTLVAQADSAVGGKNAINLGRGRNLVGTIHQPVVVISDIEVACDNAERGFRAGLAEIAKHALISPSDLLGHLSLALEPVVKRDPAAVQRVTTRSIEIKADIVSRDEREQGDRLVLNYGHTFAHAIELIRGPAADDQGEAVALGLMAAARLAFRQGRISAAVVDEHRRLLTGLGLPVQGEFRLDDMEQAWTRDKKYQHGVRFVVLNDLGRPEAGVTADTATLEGVLRDLALG